MVDVDLVAMTYEWDTNRAMMQPCYAAFHVRITIVPAAWNLLSRMSHRASEQHFLQVYSWPSSAVLDHIRLYWEEIFRFKQPHSSIL